MNQHIYCVALAIISCFLQTLEADKYTDENRPYEFGFNIEGEQHRHEKKDENGIIMGEFGFITADGVYHVTVYATDENGNFKILSMKNIRTKPYPTAKTDAKQGHSLPFPPSQNPPSTQRPQPKSISIQPPAKSCSHCSLPPTKPPQLNDLAVIARDEKTYSNGDPYSPLAPPVNTQQNVARPQNYPQQSSASPNYQQQGGKGPNYPQTGGDVSNYSGPSGSNYPHQGAGGPNYPQHGAGEPDYPHQGAGEPIYPQQVVGRPNYPQQGSSGANNHLQDGGPNYSQPSVRVPNYPQQGAGGPNFSQQEVSGQNYPQQGIGGPNNPQQGTSGPSYTKGGEGAPAPNFSQPGASRPNYPELGDFQPAYPEQNLLPPSGGASGDRNPKQFNPQTIPGQQNPEFKTQATPQKPVLISAQMQIVDKNTDIYKRGPGEKEGLPNGLTKDDMKTLLYTFNYTVGFHGHFEEGYTNGAKQGYYFVTGRNGVRTRVDYVADERGFRPKISQEVLDLISEEVPKPETEKDEKYGLKGYEFKWLYFPTDTKAKRR